MSIGIATTSIISTIMARTIRQASRIHIGTGMFGSSTGTLTIRTYIIGMSTMPERLGPRN